MSHRNKTAKLTYISKDTGPGYSDGDEVEDHLLHLFKSGLSASSRLKILSSNPSWPIRYHLAYERQNLLGWYPFKPSSSILEVGAGCGSITESLVKNTDCRIVSNDLSERRCMINAFRNSEATNLEVIVGNLFDYHPKQNFDYVVCVGVFEYAGSFIDAKNPYDEFLSKLANFLKPGGTLLLAIENQMGMKYFSGAREDHTGNYFDGINDYPQKKQVLTFGRNELSARVSKAGFSNIYFYYPYPDYKLPQVIYSDDYYPGINDVHFPRGILPTPNPDQPRHHIFSESGFMSVIERNDLYREFSNSFLVEARLK